MIGVANLATQEEEATRRFLSAHWFFLRGQSFILWIRSTLLSMAAGIGFWIPVATRTSLAGSRGSHVSRGLANRSRGFVIPKMKQPAKRSVPLSNSMRASSCPRQGQAPTLQAPGLPYRQAGSLANQRLASAGLWNHGFVATNFFRSLAQINWTTSRPAMAAPGIPPGGEVHMLAM